ncbi:DUF2523 family protein [Acinetobacter soli]|uniref:DUF2523 family protein n=1 Tax=Acinetobacter soli TaxID=487316 RepID=UPI001F36A294|nr:DUF2523 family protein [Acinetobacter soli]MCE6006667.1 DUF2523 domain-containing protein [Acinetobacter soli]
MLKFLAVLSEWLLKNSVQKIIAGAGLSVVSYLGVLIALRAAFTALMNKAYDMPADLIQMMGIWGIDHVLSTFISVAVFIMTLNAGKIAIRKKS